MGANSSVPKTAEFVNPDMEANSIIITQPVSNRIERILRKEDDLIETPQVKPNSYICQNCAKEKEKQTEKSKGIALTAYQKKLLDIENYNFESKLKELENALPKPIDWGDESKAELKELESNLLKCFQQYHGEPLHCYTNAKDYQNFVFNRQYKAILKNSQAAGDSANQNTVNQSS